MSESNPSPGSEPNPYRPPEPIGLNESVAASAVLDSLVGGSGSSVGKAILVWSLVCIFAAGPSFYWGSVTVGKDNVLAMLLGIAIFIALYVWIDFRTRQAAWRKARLVPVALKITYWLRGIMSVIFPVGMFLDLWFGMVSVTVWQAVFRVITPMRADNPDPFPSLGFIGTLAVTLTQGALLHLLLIAIFLVVWLIVFMANDFKSRRSPSS